MPHFGLIDPGLSPESATLQRSRLHMRSGRRRLREGRIPDGIVTLYDALDCALQWYVSTDSRREKHDLRGVSLNDSRDVFAALARDGTLEGTLDFDGFDSLVDKVLYGGLTDYDCADLLAGIETALTRLGVIPFDEDALPEERSQTP